MDFYPENYDVTITVPFTDPAGAQVTPSAASAQLLDGDGALIVDLGVMSYAADAVSHDITLPGAHNTVPAGELHTVRILKVSLTLPGGTIERRFSYAVEKPVALEIMKNTFMGYEYAVLVSGDFVNAAGWAAADQSRRSVALIEAFMRLTMIPMRYSPVDANGDLVRELETVILRDEWADMASDGFAALPPHFKRALRRAQFIEANELLQGDALSRKRRAGILSETIGESSVRISGGVVDFGVSSETLAALAGYIHFDMRIGRA